ncbi:MAG: carbohydrate ABC transporter permease, partial [Oscillospiraceae bacterium]
MTSANEFIKKPLGRDRLLFNIISYVVLTILSAVCLLPFLLVLSGSVSEQRSIQLHGYRLFPETVSLDAYKMLFRIPEELIRAYGVTIFVTAVGTIIG